MRNRVVFTLVMVLAGGVASAAQLAQHSVTFNLANTGGGVNNARLRFAINSLAVPGEDYFIDNVSLICGGAEILANGDFGAGLAPWKFYSNAPAPKPTIDIVGGEAVISFGNDGSNTQLFQMGLVLPACPAQCTLAFNACSTGGANDPGYGHNLSLSLINHQAPHTNYGLSLSGAPPNPDQGADLRSCTPGAICGNNDVETGEDCEEGGVNTATCDWDCTFPLCGDGLTNTAANEECDDGGFTTGGPVPGDGCDANCQLEPFCGDGALDTGEDCDNGGGTVANQTTTESIGCDTDCSFSVCGDGTLNTTSGEEALVDACIGTPPPLKVFVTSGLFAGDLVTEANILTGYMGTDGQRAGDALCNYLAGTANPYLPGVYKAWLSTDTVAAKDRLPVADRPWQLVGSTGIVADNLAGLTDGRLGYPIFHDETGTRVACCAYVWTGTLTNGSPLIGLNCDSWTSTVITSPRLEGLSGEPGAPGFEWTSLTGEACETRQRLYCFGQ